MNRAFSKLKDYIKGVDYRNYVSVVFLLLSILLGVFVYFNSYIRLCESVVDLYNSIIYYFKFLFTGGKVDINKVTILKDSNVVYPLELAFEEFIQMLKIFGKLFVDSNNFLGFLSKLFKVVFFISAFGGVVIVFLYVLYKIIGADFYRMSKKEIYEPTNCLKVYLYFLKKIIKPIKDWLKAYYEFLLDNTIYLKIFYIIWLFNLNVPSICLAFIAYMLFFAVSYRFDTLLFQLFKLILDLSLTIGGLPLIVWIVIVLIIFHKLRSKIALKRLYGMESSNYSFIEKMPITTLVVGSMGMQKTTLITDMSLTCRNIFRDKSFEILRNHTLRFPDFPWLDFARRLCDAIENLKVKSLAHIDIWVEQEYLIYTNKKYIERFNRRHCDRSINVVCYDTNLFKSTFDDGLDILSIKDSMLSYAKAFFIYLCPNYNFANYSIRFDDIMHSQGFFPLWDYDFHNRKSKDIDKISRYSIISNQDRLRIGKRIDETNKELFEFGICAYSEWGKERGNQNDHNLLKKSDKEKFMENANPLTDLLNEFVKMIRHPSTVDYFPFSKVFMDEQRADSLGADLRELADIVTIVEKSDKLLSLVGYGLEERFISFILNKFDNIYFKYLFNRGDRCLRAKLFADFCHFLYSYNLRILNTYGFMTLNLEIENGKRDGSVRYVDYYLSFKKIYSRRFTSDCYSDLFMYLIRQARRGIYQYEEYAGVKMTLEELRKQNSYFGRRLDRNFVNKE